MTYFPCLLRLSFFARIQSRLPFSGLPRICLIFSLIKKSRLKIMTACSFYFSEIRRFFSLNYSLLDFIYNWVPYHAFSYDLNCLLSYTAQFLQTWFFFRANNYHNSTLTIQKFNTILYYLLLANGTYSGFPDSETPVPSPLGNC